MVGHDYTRKAPSLLWTYVFRPASRKPPPAAATALLSSTKHMTKVLFRILSKGGMMHLVTTRF